MALRKLFSDVRDILLRATSWTTLVVTDLTNTILIKTVKNPNVVSQLRGVSQVPLPVVSVQVGPHEYWDSPEMERHTAKCHAIFASSTLFSKAIKEYTTYRYTILNGALRADEKLKGNDMWWAKSIRAMFHNVPPLPSDTYVYRGVRFNEEQRNAVESGFMVWKGFVSTSIKCTIGSNFNWSMWNNDPCCVFRIHIPQGSRVLPLTDVSVFKHESEILLDHDTSLVYLNKERVRCGDSYRTFTLYNLRMERPDEPDSIANRTRARTL
jgi:hypothetical protein